MMDEDAPEVSGRSSNQTGDRLREANEQLTLAALRAQEEIEQAARRYQGLSDANQLLVKKQKQLRSLASQLTLVEHRERKRLATELHDYLAQMIVLGRLKIGQSRLRMTPNPSVTTLLSDLDEILAQALTYTRTLMAELSPAILQQFGLAAALTALGEQMLPHGLTVEVHVPQERIVIPSDHALLLYQSVRELLLNVVKHAVTNHATVTLSIREGTTLMLSVQDQGRGFDSASLEPATGAEHFGLFSVRERMEAMGGWLQTDSAVGRGTTMTLGLPLTRAAESHPGSAAASRRHKQGGTVVNKASTRRRVLLVDDHVMVRQGLRAVLERYPDVTIVGEAQNGIEGVAMAAELMPDVIVMDINMPEMDGIEATQRIKAAQPASVVIGLSVNNFPLVVDAMKRAGAATFISKDAAADQLYRAIATFAPLSHERAGSSSRPELQNPPLI